MSSKRSLALSMYKLIRYFDLLLRFLATKTLKLSMGQQGKRRVIEEFSTEKMVGQYFELYQSLVKS